MTSTMTPPSGDVPGVDRRHRPRDFYHERTNFQFIAHSKRWLMLSGTLMLIAVSALYFRGLNLGIDFEGGTAWQVQVADGRDAKVGDVRDVLDPLGFDDAKVSILAGQGSKSVRVQAEVVRDPIRGIKKALAKTAKVQDADVTFTTLDGGGGAFTVTAAKKAKVTDTSIAAALKTVDQGDAKIALDGRVVTVTLAKVPVSPLNQVTDSLAKYSGVDVGEVTVSTVGPTWGESVSRNAVKALVYFFLLLAIYLAFRFEWKMSAAAILAVMHDVLLVVGVYAVFHFDVSPATVTAFLTILGFSLYDTVVVFDKIGENQRALTATGRSTYSEMVNRSLNAVLMRSLSTTIVALLPVISLLVVGSLIMGATALEEFAIALAAGLFIGAYSSIFVAAPILAFWKEREPQHRALAERRQRAASSAVGSRTGDEVLEDDDDLDPVDGGPVAGRRRNVEGVAGPPAVGRTIVPKPRQQRGRKRK